MSSSTRYLNQARQKSFLERHSHISNCTDIELCFRNHCVPRPSAPSVLNPPSQSLPYLLCSPDCASRRSRIDCLPRRAASWCLKTPRAGESFQNSPPTCHGVCYWPGQLCRAAQAYCGYYAGEEASGYVDELSSTFTHHFSGLELMLILL